MTGAVVFGGAGFIGTHLTERLLSAGVTVHVADLDPPPARPGLHPHRVDVRTPIGADIGPVDVAFNLAAVHRTPGHDDHEYYDTNVAGALNVTAWCAEHQIRDLVFTSSISVYGPSEEPKDETSVPQPNSAYGRSKLLAEQIHREWQAASSGRRLVVARPAVVFGHGERGNFTRLARALRHGRFAYPGRRDTAKACIYVADLVDTLLFARDCSEDSLVYNACYDHDWTIGEICEAFHEVAGFGLPRTIPRWALGTALRGLSALPAQDRASSLHPDRVRKLTASTRIVPAELRARSFPWRHDLKSALREWKTDGFV